MLQTTMMMLVIFVLMMTATTTTIPVKKIMMMIYLDGECCVAGVAITKPAYSQVSMYNWAYMVEWQRTQCGYVHNV